jgi:hypothetical protein
MTEVQEITGLSWKRMRGALELLEDGQLKEDQPQFQDLGTPQSELRLAGLDMKQIKERWGAFVNRLKGYHKEEPLMERVPIWIPIIDLHLPPGGKSVLKYERKSSQEMGAELKIFGIKSGSGGAISFSESIKFSAEHVGKSLLVLAYATITPYVSNDGRDKFFRLDWDCETVTHKIEDISKDQNNQVLQSLDTTLWKKVKEVDLSSSSGSGQFTWQYKATQDAHWNVNLGAGITVFGGIGVEFSLPLQFKRSEDFEVTFDMPYGYDYVFFHRLGETPLIPMCARIGK